MANHDFGVMMDDPQQGENYNHYEPWKYDCIAVDDDDLENIVDRFFSMDFYWGTLSVKDKGLNYYETTLIPPYQLKTFIERIADVPEMSELKKLLEKALNKNKWVIHYGV